MFLCAFVRALARDLILLLLLLLPLLFPFLFLLLLPHGVASPSGKRHLFTSDSLIHYKSLQFQKLLEPVAFVDDHRFLGLQTARMFRTVALLLLLCCITNVLSGNVISNFDPVTHKQFYSSGSYSAAWDVAHIDSLPLCRADMVNPTSHPPPPFRPTLTLFAGLIHLQQM